jgi:hypothetical protein
MLPVVHDDKINQKCSEVLDILFVQYPTNIRYEDIDNYDDMLHPLIHGYVKLLIYCIYSHLEIHY